MIYTGGADADTGFQTGVAAAQDDSLADIRAALAVVQLPPCSDDPHSTANTAIARIKRTADKVGAVLTYQVKHFSE